MDDGDEGTGAPISNEVYGGESVEVRSNADAVITLRKELVMDEGDRDRIFGREGQHGTKVDWEKRWAGESDTPRHYAY